MVERGGDVHHPVDDDRRRLERLLHLGLEDPGRAQLADIRCVDLLARVVAGLIVIAVGMQEILFVASGGVELILRNKGSGRLLGRGVAAVSVLAPAKARVDAPGRLNPSAHASTPTILETIILARTEMV